MEFWGKLEQQSFPLSVFSCLNFLRDFLAYFSVLSHLYSTPKLRIALGPLNEPLNTGNRYIRWNGNLQHFSFKGLYLNVICASMDLYFLGQNREQRISISSKCRQYFSFERKD